MQIDQCQGDILAVHRRGGCLRSDSDASCNVRKRVQGRSAAFVAAVGQAKASARASAPDSATTHSVLRDAWCHSNSALANFGGGRSRKARCRSADSPLLRLSSAISAENRPKVGLRRDSLNPSDPPVTPVPAPGRDRCRHATSAVQAARGVLPAKTETEALPAEPRSIPGRITGPRLSTLEDVRESSRKLPESTFGTGTPPRDS